MDLLNIQNLIYEIRGERVMLDRDLAQRYGVETRVLNQAVKRNIERFPDEFMFQLTIEEFQNLKSQIVISSWGGIRKMPFAFTELGVAMLSSVLASKTAITINMGIMRVFIATRDLALNPPTDKVNILQNEVNRLKEYIEDVFTDYNDINEDTRTQLALINETLSELQVKYKYVNRPRNPIGYIVPKDDKLND
jgi:hypothetical protein